MGAIYWRPGVVVKPSRRSQMAIEVHTLVQDADDIDHLARKPIEHDV